MSCKIRSWRVSYYQNDHHRWVYGQMVCSPYSVSFHADSPVQSSSENGGHCQLQRGTDYEQESADVLLHYADIKLVQRTKSMLIFPAVTVATKGGIVHWFSSLPDRHGVYNALDYFARQNLLKSGCNDSKGSISNPASKTRLGQQLLRSAEDSERTLAEAATELYGQGRQLDRAGIQLLEIHEDMDVADRLLTGLNTYLGHWTLPQEYTHVEAVHVSKGDISMDQDLEVLSSELCKDQWKPQELRILRITESGMALLSLHQRLIHNLRWMNLSRVFVVSPWEVVLTKHVAGCADVSISVVSSALFPVLKLLERKVSHIMDFQTPPASAASVVVQENSGSRRGNEKESTNSRKSLEGIRSFAQGSSNSRVGTGKNNTTGDKGDIDLQQLQSEQEEEAVSQEELLALCNKLRGLKCIATAVGNELASQNQAIDSLIESVDDADSRICDATKRTKRLM